MPAGIESWLVGLAAGLPAGPAKTGVPGVSVPAMALPAVGAWLPLLILEPWPAQPRMRQAPLHEHGRLVFFYFQLRQSSIILPPGHDRSLPLAAGPGLRAGSGRGVALDDKLNRARVGVVP